MSCRGAAAAGASSSPDRVPVGEVTAAMGGRRASSLACLQPRRGAHRTASSRQSRDSATIRGRARSSHSGDCYFQRASIHHAVPLAAESSESSRIDVYYLPIGIRSRDAEDATESHRSVGHSARALPPAAPRPRDEPRRVSRPLVHEGRRRTSHGLGGDEVAAGPRLAAAPSDTRRDAPIG